MGFWIGGFRNVTDDIGAGGGRQDLTPQLMAQVRELELQVGRLTLLSQALWELLRERLGHRTLGSQRDLRLRGLPQHLTLLHVLWPQALPVEAVARLAEACAAQASCAAAHGDVGAKLDQAIAAFAAAYADTNAAIASINVIGLDYYLVKPWDPPEENLYPVLDGLLSDWQATVPIPWDGIRVAGTQWSPRS